MENVGQKNWNNRKSIVQQYFEKEQQPFVRKSESYSKADFDMMLDAIQR